MRTVRPIARRTRRASFRFMQRMQWCSICHRRSRSHLVASPEAMQEWLDTWDGPIEIQPRDFAFNVSGDVAYGYGYLRMKGTMKSSGEAVDFWIRSSVGLRREGGRWRIVHEHTSVPFHMDGSFRPAFDLTP